MDWIRNRIIMGYNTYFEGVLKIYEEVTYEEMMYLNQFFGQDAREHPEWIQRRGVNYVDLILSKDPRFIMVDPEAEKVNEVELQLEMILCNMRDKFPNFKIVAGFLLGQGEEAFDRYKIRVNENQEVVVDWIIQNDGTVSCPHCKKEFRLE